MKRFLLIALLAALVICSCSCVEEIEADTIPALGPMASATSPKAPEPLPVIDPDTVPDTTDPSESDPNGNDPWEDQRVMQTLHLCDSYNVPCATNLASAEMLILGLQRGDLDWREMIRPKKTLR